MLIPKQIPLNTTVGEILVFKLVTSEEIIAKVVEETSEYYSVSKPMIVMPNKGGIGLMQAVMAMKPDKTVTIKKMHIMMTCPVVEQLEAYYIETTTGIKTIPKSSIIV